MEDGEDDGGGEGSDDIYKRSAEPVLVLLSNLYFDNKILVSDSRHSSCPAYMFYWLFSTNQGVYYFDLRRLFYSKQDLKDSCCSPV